MPPRKVHRWLGMREMQERRVEELEKEESMANREQKGNKEKRKQKKDKPKDTPVSPSLGSQIKKQKGK